MHKTDQHTDSQEINCNNSEEMVQQQQNYQLVLLRLKIFSNNKYNN